MKAFCILLALAVFMASMTTTSGRSCYFMCLRDLILCKRTTGTGCCDKFLGSCAPGCGVKNAKCKGTKRGSWNKRADYEENPLEEYYPMI
ncbi:hypothetical protein KP79_PYT23824 [Mizuhopecten yessoensis]|uniref:Uncharacterized protein n=1 Tax=Mizuhopecten yessoensis TaxID=6573 RepID=A0A210R1J0_MIZYE|nr:hypothetical protein KP79_PYT23824 [Mizuhopecten yessoensis]